MIATPSLSHLSSADYQNIYEPAEDTFILLDALENDADRLRSMKPRVALEIGSGSGCATSFLSAILGSSCLYLATDINALACVATKDTGSHNSCVVDAINTSFAQSIHKRLFQSLDVILFNPPIDAALSGGTDGMEVTNSLLHQIPDLLSVNGTFYLVAVTGNKIQDILAQMRTRGIVGEVILQRRAGREHLHVLRFHKEDVVQL
ncbi:putative methylase, partial [Flagelloscypha sp. PMI_526]